MADLTLLERISAMEKGRDDLGPRAPGRLEASLARHLTALLNTRQGGAPIAEDYGMPDFTDLGSSFTMRNIAELSGEIARIIMRYEPRLKNVRVTHTPRPDMPLAAVFRLEGEARWESGSANVAFETILEASGKTRLKAE